MILIADSGSTKTNWVGINAIGNKLFNTNTEGLNPSVFSETILRERISDNTVLINNKEQIKKLYFYGAGCGTDTQKKILYKILKRIFINAQIYIKEDTEAAIYAVTNTPAIVCILGTGSNCTYFDGEKVYQKIVSLGYSVMDDASGNYFGRVLLRDYFFNKMPTDFASGFATNYNLDANDIKRNLYKKENPNTYLASFSHYLIKNRKSDYAQNIIRTGIKLFIENQILQFKENKLVPIHFIGSLAFFLQDEIKELCNEYQLNFGVFERYPIHGLTKYHTKN